MNALTALGLGSRTLVMGVLNVTPDSFSDGGLFDHPESALRRALQMADEGADILDIGGESTRPATFHDSSPLDPREELGRILPVIKLIAKELPGMQLSVDTYKAVVAEAALETGATIINDISGLTYDPQMASVAAKSGCPVVIMHVLGQPRNILPAGYSDVIGDISEFFKRQIAYAESEGVIHGKIILDPGIGFGKNTQHNLEILRRLAEFKSFGCPLLIGPSRKRFVGELLGGASPTERIEGTSAAVAIGVANGADIVRVHDVKEIAKVVKVADGIVR